jgi:hypothetical protein
MVLLKKQQSEPLPVINWAVMNWELAKRSIPAKLNLDVDLD